MKIAIVGPSPVPFTIGGVENLLWGMTQYINQETQHTAELIKLPSREHNFWDLIYSYKSFYDLNLDHFDMVISTKYPAWMVQHNNHICYLQHRLRGLYDTYHFTKLPLLTDRKNKYVNNILDYIRNNENESKDLAEFFILLKDLYTHRNYIDELYFRFPGPFIKEIVHYLDNYALSQKRIKKHYCISNTVKRREEYFPKGVQPIFIHHPSFLHNYECNNYEYIFTVSRLDNPKRIDLLISAMKFVKGNIELLIAGTGPEENYLKKLADGDSRIKFLGFINDKEVVKLYSNALVIPYVPYDEDYGLITIEAMMSKKPVITCIDSGGPNEFVKNHITGFSVNPDPKEIAEKINYFIENKEKAIEMGQNGYNLVKNITWENLINKLLNESDFKSTKIYNLTPKKQIKNITVTSTFPIYPPRGGGQVRIYNLYKNVAKQFNVDIISFTNYGENFFKDEIAPNMTEIRIPKSKLHQEKEWEIERKIGLPVTDVVMPKLSIYTEEYTRYLKGSIEKSEIVILSHPYLMNEVKKYLNDKPLIYEAQDVEYILKKNILPDNETSSELLQWVYDIEKKCCEKSSFIMACSEEDKNKLIELYNQPEDKIIIIPNGVDTSKTDFIDIQQRKKIKKELGIDKEKIVLFMGSWHAPNLQACEYIFKFAEETPDIKYLIMGSQCMAFERKKLPENVGLLGILDDETKERVLSCVDVAINPMTSGSGTNLKMLDYMAAGIPVITTEFGSRGIKNKDYFIVSDIETMTDAIREVFFNYNKMDEKVNMARRYVEETYDWNKISDILINKIALLYN